MFDPVEIQLSVNASGVSTGVATGLGSLNAGLNSALQMLSGFNSRAAMIMRGMSTLFSPATLGIAALVLAFAGIGKAASDAARQWEDGFTGIAKTVDAPIESLNVLEAQLRELYRTMPTPMDELLGIGQIAGTAGIAVESIDEFTATIVRLVEASDDLSADEAATVIAQISEIAGLGAEDFENFSSAVVNLGNGLPTTEGRILSMTKRLIAAGTASGMSVPEVLALAGAFTSMGVPAEMGGSTISRVIRALDEGGPKAELFAQVIGVSTDEFLRMQETNPSATFDAFVEGLSRMHAAGIPIGPMLVDMGLGGVRVADVFGRAAANYDIFAESMSLSLEGWVGGQAAIDEYGRRMETLSSKLGVLRNSITDLFIDPGESLNDNILKPLVDGAIEAVKVFREDLSPAIQNFGSALADSKAGQALGDIALALAGLVASGAVVYLETMAAAIVTLGEIDASDIDTWLAPLMDMSGLGDTANVITGVADAMAYLDEVGGLLPAIGEGLRNLWDLLSRGLSTSWLEDIASWLDTGEFGGWEIFPNMVADGIRTIADAIEFANSLDVSGFFEDIGNAILDTPVLGDIAQGWVNMGDAFLTTDQKAQPFLNTATKIKEGMLSMSTATYAAADAGSFAALAIAGMAEAPYEDIGEGAEEVDPLTEAFKALEQATNDARAAIEGFTSPTLNLIKSQLELEAALTDIQTTLNEGGFESYNAAQQEAISYGEQMRQVLIDMISEGQYLPGTLQAMSASFVDLAVQMGIPRERALELAAALFDIPEEVLTEANLDAETAKADIEELRAQYEGVPTEVTTTITTVDQASPIVQEAMRNGDVFGQTTFTSIVAATNNATPTFDEAMRNGDVYATKPYNATATATNASGPTWATAQANGDTYATRPYSATARATDASAPIWAAATGLARAFASGNYTGVARAVDQASGIIGAAIGMANAFAKTYTATLVTRVQTVYSTVASPANPATLEYGGVVSFYAYGGINRDNMDPRVYRPSDGIRVFNEPAAGGESYIPHALDRRDRATAVLEETANMFGYRLERAGAGFADMSRMGGVTVNAPIQVSVSGVSDPRQAARLVGEIVDRKLTDFAETLDVAISRR